ncbi:MAG: Gfo/Idh/MocA family oxidoreductase [Chloroflexi bacterium]|nr:Gfo/Idh/MocA family oxidoreductase [Chloroflexota bacterium]
MSAGKLRYAVIGIQGIGRYHVRTSQEHPQVELVALVDVDAATVRRQAAELGVQPFTDHQDLLAAGLVDAVSIATPHRHLAPIGLDCLAAGLHILVEKPFATRISDARTMNELAKQRGLQIGVAYQYRTFAPWPRFKAILDSGALGKLQQGVWRWAEFRPDAYYTRSPWRATWQESGGGILLNQVSHDLDLLCWLLGQPVGVTARIANHLHQAEIEDTVTATIEFAQGVQVAFQATINQPQAASIRLLSGDRGLVVLPGELGRGGDTAEARLGLYALPADQAVRTLQGGHDQPEIRWQRLGGKTPGQRIRKLPGMKRLLVWGGRFRPKRWDSGHRATFASFVQAVTGQGQPLVSGREAEQTVELINGMILSAFLERWVDFPLDAQEYDHLFDALRRGDREVPRWR